MLQCGLFAAVGSGTAVTMGYDPFKRSLRASREGSLYAQGVGRQLWLALAFGVLVLGSSSAEAQSIIGRGDGVVTAFSGIKQTASPANPVPIPSPDSSSISTAPRCRSFRLARIKESMQGQLVHLPASFKLKARDVGQVFATLALDADGASGGSPNIYLGATSAFGLQIVTRKPGDGHVERHQNGRSNGRVHAPGQFGTSLGGGPGSIYKIDGATGAVSLFANIADNSGPGLGAIAFDPQSHQFFVSDLDTGRINRISSSGQLIDIFDHGVKGRAAPSGLTPIFGRRCAHGHQEPHLQC